MEQKMNDTELMKMYCVVMAPLVNDFLEKYFVSENIEFTFTGEDPKRVYLLEKDGVQAIIKLSQLLSNIARDGACEGQPKFDKTLMQSIEWNKNKINFICTNALKPFLEMSKTKDMEKVINKLQPDKNFKKIQIFSPEPEGPSDQQNSDYDSGKNHLTEPRFDTNEDKVM